MAGKKKRARDRKPRGTTAAPRARTPAHGGRFAAALAWAALTLLILIVLFVLETVKEGIVTP